MMEPYLHLDLENTCRACLSQNVELHSLFSTELIDGCALTFPEIIFSCIGIELESNNLLPTKICINCKEIMISYYKFKENCLQNEQALQRILAYAFNEHEEPYAAEERRIYCLDEEPITREMEYRLEIQNNFEFPDSFEELCLKEGAEKLIRNYEVFYLNEENCEDKTSTCSISTLPMEEQILNIFPEETEVINNIETILEVKEDNKTEPCEKKHKKIKRRVVKPAKTAVSLFCTYCRKPIAKRGQYEKHMRLHEATSLVTDSLQCFSCLHCRTVFLREEELTEHQLKSHNQITSVEEVVNSDDQACTDYQFLDECFCGLCNSQYSNMSDLKYHILIHMSIFSCPISSCGCEYDTLSRLSVHLIKKHSANVRSICNYCKKNNFPSFDDLQNHIKSECPAKKYECRECDKKFFSQKALHHHLKHTTEKKHICQVCGKSFKQLGELKIHNRSHTNERPFKCTVCGKSYKTTSMRTAHMDSHIEGKTFNCNICGKAMQTRTTYRHHMKRHLEDKKHLCQHCSKRFFTKYHLKLHCSKMHQIQGEKK